ncbi:FAA24 [Candida theae]|uniref:FAA24 n=1 Tax=Candida theae TaxID=1198502 RepID=A0AAD5B9X4_9ASCO|nr:FAA24 [Candida theae]KAI5948982.1 FAA24 [Candida theae]
MSSLFSDCTAATAFSRLPFGEDVSKSISLGPDSNKYNSANYSQTFRNKAYSEKLIDSIHPDLNTHAKLFNNAAKVYADRPCLGARPYDYSKKKSANHYEYLTYAETNAKKRRIGAGIIKSLNDNQYLNLDLEPHRKIANHLKDWKNYGVPNYLRDNNDHVIEKSCSFILSIFAVNRLEWMLTDLACSAYSITNTALYDTLGPDVSQYILNLTESPIVVCTIDKVRALLNLKKNYPKETKALISIVVMDPIQYLDPSLYGLAKEFKVELTDLEAIESLGKANPIQELPPSPEAIFTISFTSGTTGSRPKGAMIPHRSASSYITFIACYEPQAKRSDIAYIFLPLTHLLERETSAFAFSTGYSLGFPQTTVGQTGLNTFSIMVDDLRVLKPTYMSIVPRLLTRMESLIKEKVKQLNPEEQRKVNKIIQYKLREQAKFDGSAAYDANLDAYPPYENLRKFIGYDRLRWVQTASAPVAATTLAYLKASLNMGIRQMYGLTESGAAITCTGAYDAQAGTCGSISPTAEYKLRSVREMGYDIDKLQGEVMLRGQQMFKGYYYNQEETDKCINEHGWFHSGDIATVDENGRITIIDRVKNFFKLAQGEYVSPEKIENRYLSANPIINQLYVHGNSLKSYLVGIAGIDYEQGLKFLNGEFGINRIGMSEEEMLTHMNKIEVKTKLLHVLNDNVRGQLNGFELLHNIHIEINPLTVERDVVTPTFKLKRPVAQKFFANAIHKLYEIEQSLFAETKLGIAKL